MISVLQTSIKHSQTSAAVLVENTDHKDLTECFEVVGLRTLLSLNVKPALQVYFLGRR